MGLFSYLLVLGCWKLERCIKWYLLVHRSAIHLEIFFLKEFWKHGKAPRITLSRHSSCISLPGQYLPLIFPTTTSLYGTQGRIRTGHTCILFIVKSNRGSTEKQVMQSRSKGASVWVDGWMDGYGLLLEIMAFLSWIIHVFCFWDMVTPFSQFFWAMLLWHAIFSLFRATIIWLYFILGMFYERDHQDMEIAKKPHEGVRQLSKGMLTDLFRFIDEYLCFRLWHDR